MYQNLHYSKKENIVYVWDDKEGMLKIPFEPYAYQTDQNGEFQTITGIKVKKVKSWTKEAEKQGIIFEHDVPVATRTLIDYYFESDEPSTNHRILFFDIEVEKGLKYSSTKDAKNPITSIAYYYNGEYVCLLLDKENRISDCTKTVKVTGTDRTVDVTLKGYADERHLLTQFIKDWVKINPTIVAGWNSDVFDIPYTINRIVNILGYKVAQHLSPIKIINEREVGKDVIFKIAGITSFDYMQLYKKFTYNEESSYSLENISQKELKRGKFKYEGTLDDLYNNDLEGFIEYNVNDVELMVSLDKKLDLIEIARGICHVGHVPYDDYLFSSKYLEGALLTYIKRDGKVAFATKKTKNAEMAEGAFVKPPKAGLYKYCYDLDLESEYPNNIKTLNISPETKWGSVDQFNVEAFYDRKDVERVVIEYEQGSGFDDIFDSKQPSTRFFRTYDEFKEYLDAHKLSVSSAGILYKTDISGIIPTILTVWGNTRTEYRKKAKEYHNQGNHDLFVVYDRKQLIQKILLNSLYGVLLLPTFRFYDRENGESVTKTGQTLVQWSAKIGNLYYQKQMGLGELQDFCIYQDTDSVAGSSKVWVNGVDEQTIEDVFESFKYESHITDCSGREFVFPSNLSLPYYDENNGNILLGKVQYIEKHKVKKRRFKIQTVCGKELIVTEDHSVMVIGNNCKLIEVKPTDLPVHTELIMFGDNFETVSGRILTIDELPLEESEMYDVGMVDAPHTFFANDILVHNSCFFEALPIIQHRYDTSNFIESDFVEKTLEIAKEMEDLINKSYAIYANRYHNVQSHTWKIKQEMVGKRAFWLSVKKRYAMHITNKNGLEVDEIEIKGLDVVRSSFPKIFRKFMRGIINDVLHDKTASSLNEDIRKFKNVYYQSPINDILLPTSVKEISKFKQGQKGTPIHVKSAQNYNSLLKLFKIESVPPIDDGDKILYGYVTQNPFGFETMAIKGQGEDPPELIEFMEKYIDREKIFMNTLISKIETIWVDLGWGKPQLTESHNYF